MYLLIYSVGTGAGSPRPATWTDPRRGLVQAATDQAPAVALVPASALPSLQGLTDLVDDRGTKHPARPLARILLGRTRPTLLRGTYSCPGQMRRSFMTLLKHAEAREERNLYVVGVDDDLFHECWAAAQRTLKAKAKPAPAKRQAAPQAPKEAAQPSVKQATPRLPKPQVYGAWTDARYGLVDLLPVEPVPEALEEMYRGVSDPFRLVRRLVLRVAGHPVTVMILGETGTGKEIVAQAIHRFGPRSKKPFIPLDCGAIPDALFESIFFGHCKGAFTGADRDKQGLWEAAGEGIIFLDEIGELSLYQQAKLLRVLESGRIRRVGEVKERKVKAQVIAATSRDLAAEVAAGRFNQALYFRLFQYVIDTPPLRENPDDIRVLAQAFMREIKQDPRYLLSDEAIRELQYYSWPGNTRELKNVLTRVHLLFPKMELEVMHIQIGFNPIGRKKPPLPKVRKPRKAMAQHRLDCFWHLQRTDEAVRACKVSARNVVYLGMDDAESVEALRASCSRHLDELEGLCLKPLLFHSMETFRVVHRLKALLGEFLQVLPAHLGQALIDWRKKVRPQFKKTQEALFSEVAQLGAMYP